MKVCFKADIEENLLVASFGGFWLRIMADREKFDLDRREDPASYSTSMASDWRFGGANFANSSMGGFVPMGSSSCTSATMVDSSYVANFWDHLSSQNLGFCDINVHNNGCTSNSNGIRKDGFGYARGEMGWNPANSMLKGGAFLPNGLGMLPQSLSHFPSDSSFIERAAKFSCFGAGNAGEMNSFGITQSNNLYGRTTMHPTRDALSGLKPTPGGQYHESDLNVAEAAKDVSLSVDHLGTKERPLEDDKRGENHLVISQDVKKQALGVFGNESDRAESSGQDDSPMLECTSGDPSIKGLNSKKRKRSGDDADKDEVNGTPEQPGETTRDNSESQQKKGDQQVTSTNKASGKNAKQGSQASNPPKEEYIHVRARRGQATNSHSLAERVRREKISERMKFLQDLVPGCSKVTGKAVMLDEIINYVQSLQRQVEFLSMKLATVNPRMDFNIEGLLAKEILQHRPGPSSPLGFPPEMSMAFPALHPSHAGLVHPTLTSMANSSHVLRQSVQPHLAPLTVGFKEQNQLPDMWEDELHNVVQMTFSTTAPPSSQVVDGSAPSDQTKIEL